MVKRRKHRRTKKYAGAKKALRLAGEAYKFAAPHAETFRKKHLTKENLNKAIAASKSATSKLQEILRRKKKNGGQRITMSIFKR